MTIPASPTPVGQPSAAIAPQPDAPTADPPIDQAGFPAGRLELGLAANGDLRFAAVDLTPVLEEARARLDLSPLAAVALGRAMVGAALLQGLATKRVDRLTVEVRGDGPLRQVVAEVDAEGNLRGTVSDPHVDLPHLGDGNFPVAAAIGQGKLTVVRETRGQLHTSQVALVSGDLADDFTHFLEQSEQIESAILLGVLTKPFGIAAAGGLLIEVMPGSPDEVIATVERAVAKLGKEEPGASRLLEARGLAGLVDVVLGELAPEGVRGGRALRFACRCSRERLLMHLAAIDPSDRADLLVADGTLVADCVFCGTSYRFSPAELAG